MNIQTQDVIKACELMITSNKGITLEEDALLKNIPRIGATLNTRNAVELVGIAVKVITYTLGRDNITPRDLKKASFNLITLDS